ncbi:hypothetical protein EV356DRAFT_580437 [Viridothelium virens]|uniref:Uncharacterized protein n=1 Tax=Viridothelium virens TaxID=1048519 RepID=A0A6A6GWD2_VIRVR|nr:hypothetical protein EV356DRAFT_580437 [Viridothelium virens]
MTSNDVDTYTEGPIRDIQSDERVALDLGGGKQEIISKSDLLGLISAEFENGKDLTSIKVHSNSADGKDTQIQLHQHIWQTSLLTGPWKAEFESIWNKYIAIISSQAIPIEELQKLPGWKESVINFLDDLSTFASNEAAQRRLGNTNNAFSLG